MYQPNTVYMASQAPKRQGIFLPILVLFAIAIVAGLLVLIFAGGFTNPFTEVYLLPWVALTAVVVAAPSVYLAVKRRFDLFHPLVFAAWSYFFPAFVLGGLILASGLSKPFYLVLVPDLEYYLPLTLVYVSLGFAGLTFGFALPFGKRIGSRLSQRIPIWNWEPKDILFPGVVLLLIGIFFSMTTFTAGIIGYQRSALVETFDATLVFFSFFVSVSSFMLWYAIFRVERRTLKFKLVAMFLIFLIPYSTLLSGARGGLIQNLLPIAMAFWLSGRRIELRHGVLVGTLVVGAVLLGIVYGTTFRNVKGTEDTVKLDVYLTSASKTISVIADRGITENVVFALDTLAERMETASSLAVVVANYETLETYASDYGLAGNIWTFTWTAFIPRLFWPDKPIISDARAYSALYFDYGDNSFAITPMGDLLRNFGPIGVPIGMALLGFVLRILYTSLIDGAPRSVWRSAAYYLLLVNVSYEGFYGTILPSLLRLGLILWICGLIVSVLVRKRSRRFVA
jgi:hypothetical protein